MECLIGSSIVFDSERPDMASPTDENVFENVVCKLLSNPFWPESGNWLCVLKTNSNG